MPMRNVPEQQAAPLASLIELREGQVSSCALTRDAGVDMTLLAFAAGEGVSEEEYFGDTLYYVAEGCAAVVLPDRRVILHAGEALKVAARVLHAVEGVNEVDGIEGNEGRADRERGSSAEGGGVVTAEEGTATEGVATAEGRKRLAAGFKLLQITLHA
ncbi:hypothetical protein M1L65_06400 [Slackia exigua]|uniref:hypothetical protein n=1 Tax=Slackia exigua TaxID=84109 RepID=UPI003BA3A603